MTAAVDPAATGPTRPPDEEEPRRDVRRGAVGHLVAARCDRLQASRGRSTTVAALARLRANVGREPGSDPTIWAWTLDAVPGEPRGDAPTPEERAVHVATTHFALHQQSRPEGVHRPGVGLGQAVARLDRLRPGSGEGVSPVRRRFDVLVTAGTLDELTHHLRGLIGQLRTASVGLDYGMLADDLLTFQRPGRANNVRRRWARQLYRLDGATPAENTTTAPTEETL
jgi:CRISPR system Cascade subunit CasB